VLVVMTTNNAKALPKELYREGRIDRTMWFGGLEWGKAIKFTKAVLKTFKQTQGASEADAVNIVKWAFLAAKEGDKTPTHVSQAKLAEGVTNFVKSHMSPQLTGTG
jgi:ATP-dependent 26S proteasome regulatory subunit